MNCQALSEIPSCNNKKRADDTFIITIKGAANPRRYCAIHALAFIKANQSIKSKFTVKHIGESIRR